MWIAVQCAVQGKGHIRDNVPCQDKTCFKNNGTTYAVALADGAGSCRLSHIGAETITERICDIVVSNLSTFFDNSDGYAVKSELIGYIFDSLRTLASEQKCGLKDLSSTLLWVAVKNDKFSKWSEITF